MAVLLAKIEAVNATHVPQLAPVFDALCGVVCMHALHHTAQRLSPTPRPAVLGPVEVGACLPLSSALSMSVAALALLLWHAAAAPHILFYVVDDLGWNGVPVRCD